MMCVLTHNLHFFCLNVKKKLFRLDWNLLSTASPAINAWMNPSNRFAIRVVHMLRCRYRRCTAIVTCMMAEALDIQSIHMPAKVTAYAEIFNKQALISFIINIEMEIPKLVYCNT